MPDSQPLRDGGMSARHRPDTISFMRHERNEQFLEEVYQMETHRLRMGVQRLGDIFPVHALRRHCFDRHVVLAFDHVPQHAMPAVLGDFWRGI